MAKTMAVGKDLNNSSDFKSAAYTKLLPAWTMTRDWWGTPLDIQNAGKTYLTQFKAEPDGKYEERKSNSVPENKFRPSIEGMAGMVFRTDPTPDDLPPAINELMTDIDLCGNSFWQFIMSGFEKFLRDGNGYFYVDAPPLGKDAAAKVADGQKPTLKDRQNDRPFVVFYEASQLLNYRTDTINGRPVLVQATLEETVFEPVGTFGEAAVVQHRVLRPGAFEVLREDPKTKDFTVVYDSGQTEMTEIPLIPIAAFDNAPPMMTLLMLNISHYNKTADYDDVCHLVCVPQQVRKYESKADAEAASAIQKASPGVGIRLIGANAEAFYLEITGAGLEYARNRYQDIEKQMAKEGVGMLEPADAGVKTATEVMDTAGQRQSKLSKLTRDFENAVEKTLFAIAEYINIIKGPGTVDLSPKPADDADDDGDVEMVDVKMKLKIDYERLTFSMDQLVFFSDLVDTQKLSLDTFLHWLPQVADMPPGFDPATELKKIAAINSLVTDKMPPEPLVTDPPMIDPKAKQ